MAIVKIDNESYIEGTYVPVWAVEAYRREGKSDQDVLSIYPNLAETDLHEAHNYAFAHPEELDAAIALNEQEVEVWALTAWNGSVIIESVFAGFSEEEANYWLDVNKQRGDQIFGLSAGKILTIPYGTFLRMAQKIKDEQDG